MAARASAPAKTPAQQEITIRQVPAGMLELLDPEKITVRNIRNREPSQRLIDSVRYYGGNHTPIAVLRTPDGELVLRFGGRRRKACNIAGVPVLAVVVDGTAGTDAAEIERIFEQLDENDNREDLTAAERAGAVAELFEYGANERTVIRRTGLGKAEVAAARAVAASKTAHTLADQYPLDMPQLAIIADFDDSPEVAARLAKTAADNPGQFAYQVQEARNRRADAALVATRAAELAELGITVLSEDQSGYENRVNYWTDADGETLTAEGHKSCPGNAVYLRPWGGYDNRQVQEYWYCTDPAANGHRKLTNGKPGKTEEEAKAERRRVREGNDAWRTATEVRQQWLRDVLIACKALPAGGAVFIARAIAGADRFILDAMGTMQGGSHVTARQLLDVEKDSRTGYSTPRSEWVTPLLDLLGEASEQRAQMITFTLIIGAYEDQSASVDTWRSLNPTAREYLTTLAKWGHTLSPIEQGVVDAGKSVPGE